MLTEHQLSEWRKLSDYQISVNRLTNTLGISLQDIAEAVVDGIAPDNSFDLVSLPAIQAIVDRITRARQTAALSRMADVLERVDATLLAVTKALQTPKAAPQPGKPVPPAKPPAARTAPQPAAPAAPSLGEAPLPQAPVPPAAKP